MRGQDDLMRGQGQLVHMVQKVRQFNHRTYMTLPSKFSHRFNLLRQSQTPPTKARKNIRAMTVRERKYWPTSWSGSTTSLTPLGASFGSRATRVLANLPSLPQSLEHANAAASSGLSFSSTVMMPGLSIHGCSSLPLPNKCLGPCAPSTMLFMKLSKSNLI